MDAFSQEIMLIIIGAAAGIVTSALVGGVGYLVKRKFDKTDKAQALLEKIQDTERNIKSDLSSELGVSTGQRSISNQIGVQDGASLAYRIDEISKAITEKSDKNNNKLRKLSQRQEELKTKVSDISDIISDWQRLILENSQLTAENNQLRLDNELLNRRVSQFEQENEEF